MDDGKIEYEEAPARRGDQPTLPIAVEGPAVRMRWSQRPRLASAGSLHRCSSDRESGSAGQPQERSSICGRMRS